VEAYGSKNLRKHLMKLNPFSKLIDCIEKYRKKKQLKAKLKLRAELDKTSRYKDVDF